MRIRILTQFYPPEIGATQTRLSTLAEGLAAMGHEVDVICELPNHPHGIVHEGWAGRPIRRQLRNGVPTTYVWVRCRPEKTARERILFYGSYVAMSAVVGSALPRPDVVFGSSPPLPVGVAAAAVARRHGRPWVLDVRDLWPEAAVAMGELAEGRLFRAADRLAQRLYESAAMITVTTEPFRDRIAERITSPHKIHVVPNGTTEFWLATDALREVPERTTLDLKPDRFLWTFAGNVGGAQGLEVAIEAARRLDDGFQLLILGNGPARSGLERLADDLSEDRVTFRDQVTPAAARSFLHVSDCLLVCLRPHPSLATFVPSKLFDFCGAGRPVVLSAGDEPTRLAQEAKAALCVPPGDAIALAAAIRRLRDEAGLRQRLVAGGRAFAEANLRSRQIERLGQLLSSEETRVARSGRPLHAQ